MPRTVWAFEPIEELGGELGYLSVDDDLAEELIEAGAVQDPYSQDPDFELKALIPGSVRSYKHRQMKAENGDPPDPGEAAAKKRGRPPKGS
jgi:hypothetical protein